MLHVSIKMYPGRSENVKRELTDAIVKDVVTIAKCQEKFRIGRY